MMESNKRATWSGPDIDVGSKHLGDSLQGGFFSGLKFLFGRLGLR